MKISKIILYNEPTVPEIQLEELKQYLTDTFRVEVQLRENFFLKSSDEIFEKIAKCKVFDLKKQFQIHTPTADDILMERENIDITEKEIILYDGFELQKVITEFIAENENTQKTLHIIFTNKLTATFDESDFRYHARALIGANPTIISTTGIIEAPAKPKQYYLDVMTDFSENNIKEIKRKYKGEFLEYHDQRLNQIIKGYLLQAILYYETGEAFCQNAQCQLYNAHWQKDLLHSQIENKSLCQKHQEILDLLKEDT